MSSATCAYNLAVFFSIPGWCVSLSLAVTIVSIILVLPGILWFFPPVNTILISLPLNTCTRVPLGLPYHRQNWLRLHFAHEQCVQWIESLLWLSLWLPPYFQVWWDALVSSMFYFCGPGSPTGEGNLWLYHCQLNNFFEVGPYFRVFCTTHGNNVIQWQWCNSWISSIRG